MTRWISTVGARSRTPVRRGAPTRGVRLASSSSSSSSSAASAAGGASAPTPTPTTTAATTTRFRGHARPTYRHWLPIQTRFDDNDVYGHVNNVKYLAFFDTVVNHFLLKRAGLDMQSKEQAIGLCVESGCSYFSPLEYPMLLDTGLFVSKLSTSSIRYEVGVFESGSQTCSAHGHFVHVFVDPVARRPVPIPASMRRVVEQELLVALPGRHHAHHG